MPTPSELARLREPFFADDIEWKPIAVSKRTNKGLAAAYLTNRAIQQRLDDVCGPADWLNEFTAGPNGGVLCGLSIRIVREDGTADWVTKWDGAENTDVEAVKGGLSNAMKRAASHWGIGRYLYDLPQQWVALDDRGRFAQPPRIPSQFLPSGDGRSSGDGEAHVPQPRVTPAETASNTSGGPRPVRPVRPATPPQRPTAPERTPTPEPPARPQERSQPAPRSGPADDFLPQDLPF